MIGRRAVVTGGAGGIGLAVVRRFLNEGASVVVLDRRGDTQSSAPPPSGVTFIGCEIRDEDEVVAAFDRAAEVLAGPADTLVNCAGIYRVVPLVEITAEQWDETLDINLRGTFLSARTFARTLLATGRGGSIVNTASTAGLVADATEPTAHYNASKAAVISLTRQMAVEWTPLGIRVNAVCPGLIDTPMLRLMDDPVAGQTFLDGALPIRRLGTPDEVAAIILFLASSESSYLSGVAIPVDGGLTA
jgi:3-oxoacyl-[acyl-carrier protein] reductase